jgi:hypothetical protein
MYAETRSPDGKSTKIGDVNRYRLQDLARAARNGPPWIPLRDLLTKDSLFDDPETRSLADAESWLLTYTLMRPPRLPTFRAFLTAISARKDDMHRREDAVAQFGPLEPLDEVLKRNFRSLSRR